MPERVGILVGQEQSFPEAFIARVNAHPGIQAELARIGGTPETFQARYRVLIDRISHEVPFYRFHLKAASLAGTYVINDPFWWSADEKFFGYSLAARIGVTVPRTVLLPSKSYIAAIDPQRSLATSSTRSTGRPSPATSASPPSSSPRTGEGGSTSAG